MLVGHINSVRANEYILVPCRLSVIGNKDHLDDFEEVRKGGSVTFGVSLDNQSNPYAGTSEVTNSACTLQTPNANASEEADEDEELIVVPTTIKHSAAKVGPKEVLLLIQEEKFLTESSKDLQTQEKRYMLFLCAFFRRVYSLKILAFRRDLDQLAQKHLREVTTDKATSTNSVNFGSEPANTQPSNQDDSDMPELTIFNKH
ncbi:hypothetical protein Tco_0422922 [Tanacetum coccineum]